MKYVYATLGWGFGLLFVLSAFGSVLGGGWLGALCYLAIAGLLLPPIRRFFHERTDKSLTVKQRVVSILLISVVAGVAAQHSASEKRFVEEEKIKIEQQAQQQARFEKEREEFLAKKNEIFSAAQAAFDAKKYDAVIQQVARYVRFGDAEINGLHDKAKFQLEKIAKEKRTQELLAEIKKLQKTELHANHNAYKELASLNPENSNFSERAAYYGKEIEKAQAEELARAERKKKIEALFSAWDGSMPSLERIVKKGMNDPDSYKHDETRYIDKGDYLIVVMSFRGTNAFGGVVRNSVTAKVDLQGNVLQIL